MHQCLAVRLVFTTFCAVLFAVSEVQAADLPEIYSVGVAQVDVTPDYPVRLSGFGFRRTESEGVGLPIWAKALAISAKPSDEPLILITVDNLGVSASMTDDVAKRLAAKVGVKRARLAISASHTHTGPMLRGVAPTLFGGPIPDEHLKHIDQYTAELTDKLEQVAMAALQEQKPARLSWGIGRVQFAINRRTKGGPVDHDLPMLAVRDLDGTLRAIYVNYACHCVTLSNNKISGDWAGYTQDLIQREFPSAIAMVSIGCGADQNPSSGVTGDKTHVAMGQGAEIAAEVKRMLGGFLAPVRGEISTAWTSLTLDFAELPSRETWELRAKLTDASGYHARVQLERLDRGEALQSKLDYPIASWIFGDSLAMVFLPGEVVVDYSLRLKKELDGRRLWINAYANDDPCYIPSERVLSEGGYEASSAMFYYDRPGPLKAGLEAEIVRTVHEQLDAHFAPPFDPNKTHSSLPKSPQQSLASLQTTSNLRVDLVCAEPLISDPVAIDFGLDGSLWVAEMLDYPSAPVRSKNESGQRAAGSGVTDEDAALGRIRLVRDTDGDGQFDHSTVFLDNIKFPTGVTVWRNGVLICSAPDILFAVDTDGDDRADVVKTLFTGFGTSNIQARVNSLVYGVDGWIHGSCGLFGGRITNFEGDTYELGDRDFRMKPDTGEFEAVTGRTQQGRVRDEFGNWFGCDNTNLAFHYPLAERYLKRNPSIPSPPSRIDLIQTVDTRHLYPARADTQRFQLSGEPGTVTAACGIAVYRDSRLGPEYTGNLFVCEPVNLLVHRMILKPQGSSYVATRPTNEADTEFLRSSDAWFRPVQAVTGPDGSLWVVDMYRFIIEDPRWIPEHELAPLDVRAGSSLGRIYRVRNADDHTPPATRFVTGGQSKLADRTKIDATTNERLVNSTIYRELEIQRTIEISALSGPLKSRTGSPHQKSGGGLTTAESRMHNYRMLVASGNLSIDDVLTAIKDPSFGIRVYGIVLAETTLPKDAYPACIVDAASDDDAHVRLQVACSLGEWDFPEIGSVLARMALRDVADPYIVAAIFSSLTPKNLESFSKTLVQELDGKQPPSSLLIPFLATAVGYSDIDAIKRSLDSLAIKHGERPKAWQFDAVTNIVDAFSQRIKKQEIDPKVQKFIHQIEDAAREMAAVETLDEETRIAAINLLGRNADKKMMREDISVLSLLLSPANSPIIQMAGVEGLERTASEVVPIAFAAHYQGLSPTVQPRVIDAFLSRQDWTPRLFDEIRVGKIPASSIGAAQRQELVAHPDPNIREPSLDLLAVTVNSDRHKVIESYRESLELKGDVERGRNVFMKSCSQCHKLGDVGHAVGPNLVMIAHKSASSLLQEILDPNRNVDNRYVSYVALIRSGLTRTGILSNESSTSVTLVGTEGKQFVLLRQELDELRATGKSLMPEGLEKDLSQQAMADVISFLGSISAMSKLSANNDAGIAKPIPGRTESFASLDVPKPSAEITDLAKRILDDTLSEETREALIADHPKQAAELVVAMTVDMPKDVKEEYRRIPWIWRVAVACGKRDQSEQIRSLLEVSVPKPDQPLKDWEAVVIGGGVINGIGLKGGWPRTRLDEILKDDAELSQRWQAVLVLASAMADDEKTPTGTRYDAMRIIALDGSKSPVEQLAKYLPKGTHDELQMGAISGLSDIDSKEIPQLLLENFNHFNEENRELTIDALIRTEARSETLLDALSKGRIQATLFNSRQRKMLRESKSPLIRDRANQLLRD